MNENVAIGAICAGLLVTVAGGAVADLRMSAEAEQLMSAAEVLTQPACAPPIVAATYNDPGCASQSHQNQVNYYQARMVSLARN